MSIEIPDEAKSHVAQLERDKLVAEELLALVLNEVGPVEIDRKKRTKLPADTQIMIDINHEAQTVTISLGVPGE